MTPPSDAEVQALAEVIVETVRDRLRAGDREALARAILAAGYTLPPF